MPHRFFTGGDFYSRLLGQLDGPRYAVEGEQGNLRAIAGDGDGYKHLIVWRYEDGGPDEIE